MADEEQVLEILNGIPKYGQLQTAAVTRFSKTDTQLMMLDGQTVTLPFEDMQWAAPYIEVNKKGAEPKRPQDVLKVGDVVYLQKLNGQWQLAQDPLTEAGLISVNPKDGQIFALVGGFDFFRSKFNRVVQARRQPGSNFKPFLYAAAFDKGLTPATTINDAPVVFHEMLDA